MITKEQLIKITKKPTIVDRIYDSMVICFNKYEINTPLRECHFLAQVLHESGCFLYFEEIASGKAYEGRKDLGNTHVGDGVLFKGRAFIQITGRANYEAISKDLDIDFISNPKLLASDKYAFLASGWFWNRAKLNVLADLDNFEKITRKINGGINGIEDRKKWLKICKEILMEIR